MEMYILAIAALWFFAALVLIDRRTAARESLSSERSSAREHALLAIIKKQQNLLASKELTTYHSLQAADENAARMVDPMAHQQPVGVGDEVEFSAGLAAQGFPHSGDPYEGISQ